MSKERELLERAYYVLGELSYAILKDSGEYSLAGDIYEFLAEPEVKREQFSDDVVADSYFQVQPILGEYLKFKAGFRMAEKMHGIGGGDE